MISFLSSIKCISSKKYFFSDADFLLSHHYSFLFFAFSLFLIRKFRLNMSVRTLAKRNRIQREADTDELNIIEQKCRTLSSRFSMSLYQLINSITRIPPVIIRLLDSKVNFRYMKIAKRNLVNTEIVKLIGQGQDQKSAPGETYSHTLRIRINKSYFSK